MQLHFFFMLRFHFSCIENDAQFFDHLFRVFYMSKNMDLPENQLFAHLFFKITERKTEQKNWNAVGHVFANRGNLFALETTYTPSEDSNRSVPRRV